MKTIKTEELTGPALDWAVANLECDEGWLARHIHLLPTMPFSSDWAQGGPIIEREKLNLSPTSSGVWECWPDFGMSDELWEKGPTPLIAAMRCYVASKLGDEVEIPNELL